MSSTLTPREQRRIDTDNAILKAAVRLFGQNGYTRTSLTDIAAAAGVSQGLVSQRFDSKESLLTAAYRWTGAGGHIADATLTGGASAISFLKETVSLLKDMARKEPETFAFIAMVFCSGEVPEAFIRQEEASFRSSGISTALKEAQKEGLLPKADVWTLFLLFYRNVLSVIRDTQAAGIPAPGESLFLAVIGCHEHDEGLHTALDGVLGYIGLMKKRAEEPERIRNYADKATLIGTELRKKL